MQLLGMLSHTSLSDLSMMRTRMCGSNQPRSLPPDGAMASVSLTMAAEALSSFRCCFCSHTTWLSASNLLLNRHD